MTELIVSLAIVYVVGTCLMMALWSFIPPRNVFIEVINGFLWPAALGLLIVAAPVNAIIRGLQDQNGELAGLYKNSKWVREHRILKGK